jgi:dTMP kinase
VWCILDRWLHSSLIYQGLARGLPVDEVKQLSIFATANLRADRVLALQVSAETARARQRDRDGGDGDRIEESVNAETIRNGYADLKTLDGHAVVEVSAEGTREEMLSLCWQAISDLLP